MRNGVRHGLKGDCLEGPRYQQPFWFEFFKASSAKDVITGGQVNWCCKFMIKVNDFLMKLETRNLCL